LESRAERASPFQRSKRVGVGEHSITQKNEGQGLYIWRQLLLGGERKSGKIGNERNPIEENGDGDKRRELMSRSSSSLKGSENRMRTTRKKVQVVVVGDERRGG